MPIVLKDVIHVKKYTPPDDGIEYAEVSSRYHQENIANFNAHCFPEVMVPINRIPPEYKWEEMRHDCVKLIFG